MKRIHLTIFVTTDITNVLCPKPETTAKHMCMDYCCLNKKTIQNNNYPLLLISKMIDKIGDAKVFRKLDFCWEFNNVQIKGGDEWKAVFTCHEGAFEPLVMYFGLTNSPSTSQTMMNALFFDMCTCVMVYMDNILIYMATKEGHDEIVLQVLEILICLLKPKNASLKSGL